MNPDLKKRVFTAGALIAIFLSCIVASKIFVYGWLTLTSLFFLAVFIATLEFVRISQSASLKWRVLSFFVIFLQPVVACLCVAFGHETGFNVRSESTIFLPLVVSMFAAVALLVARGYSALSLASDLSSDIFLGILLIGLGGASLLSLTFGGQFAYAIIWLILVVCSNDSAAYFIGKYLGGPHMAPCISPNKTISGCVAGFAFGVLFGFLFIPLLPVNEVNYFEIGLLSLCVVVASQLGDLTKSFIKRRYNVKDSGKILPGHGGVLDRIDGMLMSAPVLTGWIIFVQG